MLLAGNQHEVMLCHSYAVVRIPLQVHKVSQAQGSRSVPSWLLRSCPQVAVLDGETLQRFIQRLALQVVMKVCSPFAINDVA